MEAMQSAAVSETQPSENPQVISPQVSSANQLKSLLAQARGTRQMLMDFKAALDDCTVHGSHVYAMALGVQFLESLLKQAKGDIDNIQNKLDAEAK